MTETLTQRQLNRALLARQLLLDRADLSVVETVEHVIGLQSQVSNPPYMGLWTRLRQFQRDDLTTLIATQQIVRAAMMRSTLHLMTAGAHRRMRSTLQPALSRALRAFYGKRAQGLDIDKLVNAARPFLEETPRTTGELRAFLLELEPDRDGEAMAYAVRNHLPLIQVMPGGTWGSGSGAAYTTAESVLGAPEPENLRLLLHRYLAAFGPASVMDFQAWSGMVKLQGLVAPLKADLIVYADEQGRELLDLPDSPLPDKDTSAPIRYIPAFDNLILSHADRTRIISDSAYKKVFLSAGRVQPTILLDGFVAGRWKSERQKTAATLTVEPFRTLSKSEQDALAEEGDKLLRFIEADAASFSVVFGAPI